MGIERTATCPECGRAVRLTEQELLVKRGFCAVCDARFDILPELLLGEGPLRTLEVVQVSDSAQPPTRYMRVLPTKGDETHIRIRPRPRVRSFILGAGFSVWFASIFPAFWHVFGRIWGHGPLFLLLFVGMVGGMGALGGKALFHLAGVEEVTIEGRHLRRRRSLFGLGFTQSVPLEEVERFVVKDAVQSPFDRTNTLRHSYPRLDQPKMVQLIRRGEEPLRIGADLGHSEEAMNWLCRRLERGLRLARSRVAWGTDKKLPP